MISKNLLLNELSATYAQRANIINKLVYDWHKSEGDWVKRHPNYVKEDLFEGLLTAGKIRMYLYETEAHGFRGNNQETTLNLILKNAIVSKQTISVFGILCPSYKKGHNVIGFSSNPGNTTHRAFKNIINFCDNLKHFNIQTSKLMLFADISLERSEKYKKKDWDDLVNIIAKDSELAQVHNVEYKTLTEFEPSLKHEVGYTGKLVDISNLPIDKKALERAMWRDRKFYPEMFGWSIKEAEERTVCHAHSYYWQGVAIRANLVNPIMVYSAYDYEKGGLYNGPDGTYPPAIIYPQKDPNNPPEATLALIG